MTTVLSIELDLTDLPEGGTMQLEATPKTPAVLAACTHPLKKTTDSTGAYSSGVFCCDVCHAMGLNKAGRLNCATCQIDVCNDCFRKEDFAMSAAELTGKGKS